MTSLLSAFYFSSLVHFFFPRIKLPSCYFLFERKLSCSHVVQTSSQVLRQATILDVQDTSYLLSLFHFALKHVAYEKVAVLNSW